MLNPKSAFSGFTVNNLDAASEFYGKTLGFTCEPAVGGLKLILPDGFSVWVYAKNDHQAPSYTLLNLVVDDIDAAVDELVGLGVKFEQYNMDGMPQDEKGVLRGLAHGMGPDIAWFKDPAGNTLAILQQQ